jgi:CheY-like chemotaxis protein
LVSQLDGQHCLIKADRVRLRQIVDNLLTNANKFTPAGGTIELVLAVVAERAVVTVRDSGVGFDSDFAAKLFEPFTQQEHRHDRPSGGLGLGLAIASRLAQLQGGSLSAASEGADRGATFTLSIPIAAESDDVVDANAPRRLSTRKSVLLVEDNRDVADSLADLLALAGFRVTVANNGASALVCALQLVPDLILCDLGLPGGMDGFAVARACRAEPSLHAVRLIAASGYGSVQDHTNAKEAGFDYLLTKPLTHKSLALIAQQMN